MDKDDAACAQLSKLIALGFCSVSSQHDFITEIQGKKWPVVNSSLKFRKYVDNYLPLTMMRKKSVWIGLKKAFMPVVKTALRG
jgi:hypothetical protein